MNCTIPALVSRSDGSSGIRDEEGMRFMPLSSKNRRYFSRISAVLKYFMSLLSIFVFLLAARLRGFPSCLAAARLRFPAAARLRCLAAARLRGS